jgi:hypothetical protein
MFKITKKIKNKNEGADVTQVQKSFEKKFEKKKKKKPSSFLLFFFFFLY